MALPTTTCFVLLPLFLYLFPFSVASSTEGTPSRGNTTETQLDLFLPTAQAKVTPLATSACYKIHPKVVYLPESPLQVFEAATLESCKRYCWFLPGCDSFIYHHLDTSCLVYGIPVGIPMQLLKHEVYGETSCFMFSGEVSASCEEVQEIERYSREEGALMLNLLTNTCIGAGTRKNINALALVGCHEAPLWTLEITSIEPRLIRLRMKGTEKCMQSEGRKDQGETIYSYQGIISDCGEADRQEFLLRRNTTRMLGMDSGRYCHRPMYTPGDVYVFLSHKAAINKDIFISLEVVTFARRSRMEFPCYWNRTENGELVWTDSSGMFGNISTPPPFVLPGDQALIRCMEGFEVQSGDEWLREIRVTCTGNVTQSTPTCEKIKKKIDLMMYLDIGQASIILILLLVTFSLIHRIMK